MSDLTTPQGVLAYLSNTRFAATDVQRITGGFSAFTYRVTLSFPLEDGCTTVVLKHYEDHVAKAPALKVDPARSGFEYNALLMMWDSGLVDFDSTVQVPRPINYDRETHTIILSDLGSDVVRFDEMLGDHLQRAYNDSNREEIRNIASSIGSALGDFLGRLHKWSTLSEHRQSLLSSHRWQNATSTFCSLAARSATKFGVNEEWLADTLAEELANALTDNEVIIMGDCSLSNILVHRNPDIKKLRVYVVDWELSRPSCPERDFGELTGTWLSFAHYHHIHGDFPFLPSLYHAYHKHYAVDRTRMALQAGLYTMGLGTTTSWVRAGGDEIYKQTTMLGYDLMKLAREGDDCVVNAESPLKILFR